MHNQLGAHEAMEVHEVLSDTINGINQFRMYQPMVKDQQLSQILDNQIQHMTQNYNQLVNMVNSHGMQTPGQQKPYTTVTNKNYQPTYGQQQQQSPTNMQPHQNMQAMDDHDIAVGMLSCHKSSAVMHMSGALECANPQIRQMIEQSSVSCCDQAYEVFQYMNDKGYYQVPQLDAQTTQTMLNQYQPVQQNNQLQ